MSDTHKEKVQLYRVDPTDSTRIELVELRQSMFSSIDEYEEAIDFYCGRGYCGEFTYDEAA